MSKIKNGVGRTQNIKDTKSAIIKSAIKDALEKGLFTEINTEDVENYRKKLEPKLKDGDKILGIYSVDLNQNGIHDTSNENRPSGGIDSGSSKVKKLIQIVKNGELKPKDYPPPVLILKNGEWVPKSGNHRVYAIREAKKGCDQSYVFAIVEFGNDQNEMTYVLNENEPTFDNFFKSEQSKRDIYLTIARNIQTEHNPSGVFENEQEIIEDFIRTLDYVLKEKSVEEQDKKVRRTYNAVSQIIKTVNPDTKIDYIHSWDTRSVQSAANDYKLKHGISKNQNVFVTQADRSRNGDGGLNPDVFKQMIRVFTKKRDDDPDTYEYNSISHPKLKLYTHMAAKYDSCSFIKTRNEIEKNLIKQRIKDAYEVVHINEKFIKDGKKNGLLDLIDIHGMPQLGNEISNRKSDEVLKDLFDETLNSSKNQKNPFFE